MNEQKIIYEPHPVTPERKAELRAQGYKIIDAVFDPNPQPASKKTKPAQATQDSGDFDADAAKAYLTEIGVAFPRNIGKAKLKELYDATVQGQVEAQAAAQAAAETQNQA